MADDPFQHRFAGDASLLPHMADLANDRVLIALLTEADYRAASFLDQRLLTDRIGREWMAWDALPDLGPAAPRPHHIFHIGHVGSTLVSRLLAETADVLPLREPMLLRTLAQVAERIDRPESVWSPDLYRQRLAQVSGWFGRGFAAGQVAMVKASSVITAIADDLTGADGRALFLYAPVARYIETILAGEASLAETLAQAPARMARLAALLPDLPFALWQLPPVTRVAMSWLCEMATAARTLPAADPRHLWVDFEAMLADPAASLTAQARHFGLAPDAARIETALAGPIMRQYSKAPEHGYSPDLRRQLQAQAAAEHAPAIAEAIAWVEALAARDKTVGDLPIHGG
ncbi:hypothetical protein ASD67_11235 [Sphingopyxis sp. Root1497]|uniref:hypothetical protein n=1 Tax=Sphingopyxis sp. Root1497 TaxID=1736474 RepID=UPI0006FD090B|nr:hypothetical protein [Sphingopyxis sp. Root1497]KQZ64962.1 hypothetical protein ASD67_11235 [Sphingopyxis sp. Root1497]